MPNSTTALMGGVVGAVLAPYVPLLGLVFGGPAVAAWLYTHDVLVILDCSLGGALVACEIAHRRRK